MPSRREALRQFALGSAAVVSSPAWVEHLLAVSDRHAAHRAAANRAAAAAPWTPKVLNAHQNEMVIAAAERIVPETDTPGATAAQVNRYIDEVLADAAVEDREGFLHGLAWLDERCQSEFGRQFSNASYDQQVAFFRRLDAAARLEPGATSPFAAAGDELIGTAAGTTPASASAQAVPPEDRPGVDVYRALKALTVAGYYTSEVGLMQEIGDPGPVFETEFKGCTHPEHGAR